jgi:hypothetical protein
MMKDKDDDTDDRPDDETSQRENDEDKSNADPDADETKRFERSDNLRRRSEWFQKRTGGG